MMKVFNRRNVVSYIVVMICLWFNSINDVTAFAPPVPRSISSLSSFHHQQSVATTTSTSTTIQLLQPHGPTQLQRRKYGRGNVRLFIFGLGAPEIAIILIAAAFLLGPQKLAELGKDAGKIAGELKEVPKEFQAGLMEGEAQAKAMKEAAPTTSTDESTKSIDAVKVEDAAKKE